MKLGDPLSPKQAALMDALLEGSTISKISENTGMSQSTVSTHMGRVRIKLGAKTTLQAGVIYDRMKPR